MPRIKSASFTIDKEVCLKIDALIERTKLGFSRARFAEKALSEVLEAIESKEIMQLRIIQDFRYALKKPSSSVVKEEIRSIVSEILEEKRGAKYAAFKKKIGS